MIFLGDPDADTVPLPVVPSGCLSHEHDPDGGRHLALPGTHGHHRRVAYGAGFALVVGCLILLAGILMTGAEDRTGRPLPGDRAPDLPPSLASDPPPEGTPDPDTRTVPPDQIAPPVPTPVATHPGRGRGGPPPGRGRGRWK